MTSTHPGVGRAGRRDRTGEASVQVVDQPVENDLMHALYDTHIIEADVEVVLGNCFELPAAETSYSDRFDVMGGLSDCLRTK